MQDALRQSGIPQGRSVPERHTATGYRSSRNKVQCRTHCTKAAGGSPATYRPSPTGRGWANRQTSFSAFAFLARPALTAGRFCFAKDRQNPLLPPKGGRRGSKKSSIYDLKKLKKDFVYSLLLFCDPDTAKVPGFLCFVINAQIFDRGFVHIFFKNT